MDMTDVVIIGGGPAGLAVAETLQSAGLGVVVFEKGAIADCVRRWPYYLRFFSTAPNLELAGFPLIIRDEKPTREEYLAYLRRFVQDKHLDVRTGHSVTEVRRNGEDDGFLVRGTNEHAEWFEQPARFVVVATGAYDYPQMLNVPGEDLPKVSHYFTEVHPYAFRKVAVIGGKSSAVETALLLQRAHAEVTLIHRGPRIEGIKYWLQPDIENRISAGEIKALFKANVIAIRPHVLDVRLESGKIAQIENDYVLAMTGYQPDLTLLSSMGVVFNAGTKRPQFDPSTFETNVPGIYVAGVVISGSIGGQVFIENARDHGAPILASIRAKRGNA